LIYKNLSITVYTPIQMTNAFKIKYIVYIIPIFFIFAIIFCSNNYPGLIYAQSSNNTNSTYQNSTYGITIKYPTVWKINDSGGIDDTDVDIVTFLSPDQNNNASLDVHQDKLDNASSDIGSYLRFTTSSYKDELKNFKVIESDTNSSLAGNAAYKLIYTYTNDDGTTMKDLETGTVMGNNKVYYLVYDNLESDYQKYLPTVQSMIKSLQIH
jgi:eukaryotic-like serine/threonine-protein kinase